MGAATLKRSKLANYIEQITEHFFELSDLSGLKNLTSFAYYLNEEELDDYIQCYEKDHADILKINKDSKKTPTKTVSIKPVAIPVERVIMLYEAMNDLGKAGFILTLEEKHREPFLKAYEKHFNSQGDHA